jgi:hypothetical protein
VLEEVAWLIENPAIPGVAEASLAVKALRDDHLEPLRISAAIRGQQST